jgi:hypothetical protein
LAKTRPGFPRESLHEERLIGQPRSSKTRANRSASRIRARRCASGAAARSAGKPPPPRDARSA